MAFVRHISTGEALSILARRGMNMKIEMRRDPDTGLLMFDPPDNVPLTTPKMAERAQELDDLQYANYIRKP
jgi:hypothetical protein